MFTKNIKNVFQNVYAQQLPLPGFSRLGSACNPQRPSAIATSGALCLVWKRDEIFRIFFCGGGGGGLGWSCAGRGPPRSLWNLSYATRDGTDPGSERHGVLTTGSTGAFPLHLKSYMLSVLGPASPFRMLLYVKIIIQFSLITLSASV